jgi:hypothetical protein
LIEVAATTKARVFHSDTVVNGGNTLARINIEDSLYKDSRFIKLCIILRDLRTALGALFQAWALAQDHVEIDNPEGVIPLSEWKKQGISNEIIDVGLAEVRGDVVYISGAREQFAWLVQAKIKGRKGGQAQLSPAKPSSSSAKPLYSSLFTQKNNNTATKEEMAERCIQAIVRFGPNESEKLREFVGEECFEKIRKSGGWSMVRALKPDQFQRINVMRMLSG